MRSKLNTIAVTFALAAAGFVLSFWPLSLVGILFGAVVGRTVTAVLLGLLLDVAYGPPTGALHILYVPFTLFALACALGRILLRRHLFEKSPQETL